MSLSPELSSNAPVEFDFSELTKHSFVIAKGIKVEVPVKAGEPIVGKEYVVKSIAARVNVVAYDKQSKKATVQYLHDGWDFSLLR